MGTERGWACVLPTCHPAMPPSPEVALVGSMLGPPGGNSNYRGQAAARAILNRQGVLQSTGGSNFQNKFGAIEAPAAMVVQRELPPTSA
jgi:hypothetical protein